MNLRLARLARPCRVLHTPVVLHPRPASADIWGVRCGARGPGCCCLDVVWYQCESTKMISSFMDTMLNTCSSVLPPQPSETCASFIALHPNAHSIPTRFCPEPVNSSIRLSIISSDPSLAKLSTVEVKHRLKEVAAAGWDLRMRCKRETCWWGGFITESRAHGII